MLLLYLLFIIVATTAIPGVYSADKIIGNNNVLLGVDDFGSLCINYIGNVVGLPASDPLGFGNFCLRNNKGQQSNAGFYSGIDYDKGATTLTRYVGEGWYVVIDNNVICQNYAFLDNSFPNNNLVLTQSTGQNGDNTSSSDVLCGNGTTYRVTHMFQPSASEDLMTITVSVTSNAATNTSIVYIRSVGWDIYPTSQSIVTHIGVNDTRQNNGSLFMYNNFDMVVDNADGHDIGPGNLTSVFGIPINLAPGQNKSFHMYYGLSAGLEAAKKSLSLVKAEMAAMARASNSTNGLPYTYIMAFSDIGGPPLSFPTFPPSTSLCFSGVNTVEERYSGMISITEVKIGDYVKASTDRYTQVYGFGHLDRDREELFLQIHLEKMNRETILEISSKHIVFIERNSLSIPLQASNVIVGDFLSGKMVISIQYVWRQGVYAPLTMSGDIIVSDIRSSNYVNVLELTGGWYDHHTIGHVVWGPRRLFCRYFMEVCKQETYYNGYHFLSIVFLASASLLNNAGWIFKMLTSIIIVLVVNIVYVFEYQPIVGVIGMLLVIYMTWKNMVCCIKTR